jgi:hypothetical protein
MRTDGIVFGRLTDWEIIFISTGYVPTAEARAPCQADLARGGSFVP